MKLAYLVFCIFFISVSCKSGNDLTYSEKNTKTSLESNGSTLNQIDTSQNTSKCEEIVLKIIKSSNLKAIEDFKNIEFRIDSYDDEKLVIRGYELQNVSEIKGQIKNQENTVAWIEFYPNLKSLIDITFDPENPIHLTFDHTILNQISENQLCNINLDYKPSQKFDCKEIQGDMMSGEECFFPNQILEQVYQTIQQNKLVENSSSLLNNLPTENQKVQINQNGLILIEYEVNPKNISINMLYEGGVTSIELIQKNNGVLRKIILSAG